MRHLARLVQEVGDSMQRQGVLKHALIEEHVKKSQSYQLSRSKFSKFQNYKELIDGITPITSEPSGIVAEFLLGPQPLPCFTLFVPAKVTKSVEAKIDAQSTASLTASL